MQTLNAPTVEAQADRTNRRSRNVAALVHLARSRMSATLRSRFVAIAFTCAVSFAACGGGSTASTLTISGSAVGTEAQVLQRQLQRFQATHPLVPVTRAL